MIDFDSALELMRKYGYSSTSVHPFIYKKGDTLGICYSYIDENYKKGYNYHIDEESIEIYIRSRDTSSDFSAGNRTDIQIVYLRYMISKMKDIQDGKLSLTFEDLYSIMSKCETNLTNT